MTEGVSSSSDAVAERAAEQARLRKERREAKIKAGGSARLNKINGMGGRIVREDDKAGQEPITATKTTISAPQQRATASTTAGDPDEVDISNHSYTPGAAPFSTTDPFPADLPPPTDSTEAAAQLRRLLLAGGGNEDTMSSLPPGAEQDPLMKMMSQMMTAGAPNSSSSAASATSAAPPFPLTPQQTPSAGDAYNTLWRAAHALLALSLGLYIVLLTPFDGTHQQRRQAFRQDHGDNGDSLDHDSLERARRTFFWAFATAEAVLLTTRLLVDSMRSTPSAPQGLVGLAVSQLPAPWRDYVLGVRRYGRMLTTVRTDMLLCVFVLGACAWWKGRL